MDARDGVGDVGVADVKLHHLFVASWSVKRSLKSKPSQRLPRVSDFKRMVIRGSINSDHRSHLFVADTILTLQPLHSIGQRVHCHQKLPDDLLIHLHAPSRVTSCASDPALDHVPPDHSHLWFASGFRVRLETNENPSPKAYPPQRGLDSCQSVASLSQGKRAEGSKTPCSGSP
jgi:hypothetical protein